MALSFDNWLVFVPKVNRLFVWGFRIFDFPFDETWVCRIKNNYWEAVAFLSHENQGYGEQ